MLINNAKFTFKLEDKPSDFKIMILKFYVFVNLPLPEVWSEEGPVGEDDVPPLFRVQSNVSFLSCVKPHIELSKLHAVANENKSKNMRLKQLAPPN